MHQWGPSNEYHNMLSWTYKKYLLGTPFIWLRSTYKIQWILVCSHFFFPNTGWYTCSSIPYVNQVFFLFFCFVCFGLFEHIFVLICLFVWLIWAKVAFTNLSVISGWCLDVTGSSMLTFRVLPHWNVMPQTLWHDISPSHIILTLSWPDPIPSSTFLMLSTKRKSS